MEEVLMRAEKIVAIAFLVSFSWRSGKESTVRSIPMCPRV
jgi:hypothetical protein